MTSVDYPGAASPPPGFEPDLENPEDVLKTILIATQGLTLLFVTLFVGVRIYAKSRLLGAQLSWDDWATYASYVLMVGYCITGLFAAKYGGGLNNWEVSPENLQEFLKSGYAATLFYAPMAMTVKLALLIIIIRVFGAVHRKTLIGIYVLIGVIVVYYVSGLLIKVFICWPIHAYWRGETDRCLDQSAIITADAIISVISDLAILVIPTPLTWSLQLSKKRRLRIAGMLGAGGIATAFSIYRLVMIVQEGKSSNQTIVFTKVVLSGNAEAGIGLMCACLPAVNAIFARAKGSSYYANQHSRSGAQELGQGGIVMTRTFHVDTTSKGPKDILDEFGHDQAVLTSDVQANPHCKSASSSRRSESTDR